MMCFLISKHRRTAIKTSTSILFSRDSHFLLSLRVEECWMVRWSWSQGPWPVLEIKCKWLFSWKLTNRFFRQSVSRAKQLLLYWALLMSQKRYDWDMQAYSSIMRHMLFQVIAVVKMGSFQTGCSSCPNEHLWRTRRFSSKYSQTT